MKRNFLLIGFLSILIALTVCGVVFADGFPLAPGSAPGGMETYSNSGCDNCCREVVNYNCGTCVQPTSRCADVSGKYCVRYHTNNCLESAPVDPRQYSYGETVTVLFDPVIYKPNGMIFHGWSHYPYGPAQYGYAYNQFRMPARDVDLYAICIAPYYGPGTTCPQCDWPNDWPYWPPTAGQP